MTSKRRRPKPETDVPAELPNHPPPLATSSPPPSAAPPSLAQIRARALTVQVDAAHTIAELEAWRAEIDCTIAFLKAQRR